MNEIVHKIQEISFICSSELIPPCSYGKINLVAAINHICVIAGTT